MLHLDASHGAHGQFGPICVAKWATEFKICFLGWMWFQECFLAIIRDAIGALQDATWCHLGCQRDPRSLEFVLARHLGAIWRVLGENTRNPLEPNNIKNYPNVTLTKCLFAT